MLTLVLDTTKLEHKYFYYHRTGSFKICACIPVVCACVKDVMAMQD